jgi:hypothetical protein
MLRRDYETRVSTCPGQHDMCCLLTDLERRDEVGSLEKSQLTNLVDNGGDLGVGGSSSSVG